MDPLSHQLLFDLVQALQHLGGAHEDTDTSLRFSIVCAFERIQQEREGLTETDWTELRRILTELEGLMTDDEFVYSALAFSGRKDVDLQPFLAEIRCRTA